MDYALLVFFWGSILFAIGLAFVRGLPRWSISYLGFVLIVRIVLDCYDRIWGWIYPYFLQSFGPIAYILAITDTNHHICGNIRAYHVFYYPIARFGSGQSVTLPAHTRGVWQLIRADWTQLSFMLYSMLVFDTLLTFEEYHHEDVWKFTD
jgi:hypothetical protein